MTRLHAPAQERDRMKSPSINFPQSPEEAEMAILRQIRKVLTEEGRAPLSKEFTVYAGLGTYRSEEQAGWLNEAVGIIGPILLAEIERLEANARANHQEKS